jgi:phosphatidylglycerol:prolipoprotein diacylglycerol transferase
MHPILFKLSVSGREIPFYSYGFLMGLGIFLGVELTLRLAEREGLPKQKVWLFAVGVVIAGYIGSHVHSLMTDEILQAQNTGFFQGVGFTFYGAALSGMIAAFPLAWLLRINVWKILDAGACGTALAHGIGRIGCFLWGCCYGVQCSESNPFGVHFPPGSPAFKDQVFARLIPESAPHALPVFPTMLVESAWELAVAAGLTAYLWRRPKRLGSIVLIYLVAYGPLRVLIERYRADPGRGTLLGLSTSTTIGIATTLFGLAFLLVPRLAALRPLRPVTGAPAPAPEQKKEAA